MYNAREFYVWCSVSIDSPFIFFNTHHLFGVCMVCIHT